MKRLAGTSWGSDKETLWSLYMGYVRSVIEYSSDVLVTGSKTSTTKLNQTQNNALRFEPLDIRRDRAALELFERSKRMEKNPPNRQLVDTWKPHHRLKQISVMHHIYNISEKYHLQEKRQEIV
jgi:hypothetical protein